MLRQCPQQNVPSSLIAYILHLTVQLGPDFQTQLEVERIETSQATWPPRPKELRLPLLKAPLSLRVVSSYHTRYIRHSRQWKSDL